MREYSKLVFGIIFRWIVNVMRTIFSSPPTPSPLPPLLPSVNITTGDNSPVIVVLADNKLPQVLSAASEIVKNNVDKQQDKDI